MVEPSVPLAVVFDGWNGYRQSIVNAVQPLTREQLAWRPAGNFRSVGELVRHISLGRLVWFVRMDAPGCAEIADRIPEWEQDEDGNWNIAEPGLAIAGRPGELVQWLEMTGAMIAATLAAWTVADLRQTYRHVWNGQAYAVSRQWTIWRILNHDLHHGGELSLMLGLQGIEPFELSGLFGHTVLPPLWED